MNKTTSHKLKLAIITAVAITSAALAQLGQDQSGHERLRGGKGITIIEQPKKDISAAALQGNTVNEIKVVGNVSLTRAQVLSAVRTRTGQSFDIATADEDSRRIAELEGVEYAYYNTNFENEKLTLTFVVVERNLIRSIEIQGNVAFNDSKLIKKAALKKGDYLDIFIVRGGSKAIEEYYMEKGFAEVNVTVNEEKLDLGQVVYNVYEGPRVKIAKINFSGNKAIKSSEIKRAMKTKTREWIFWPGYYSEKKLAEDKQKLKDLYLSKGYLDSSVETEVLLSEDKSNAFINFYIQEGIVYIVEDIIIKGNEKFDEQKLLEETKLTPGRYYSTEMVDFDKEKIIGYYLENGYINAQIEHERVFPAKGKVNAIYTIIPGQQYKIGDIKITGNQTTEDNVVRRVLNEEDFVPGKWYNAKIAKGDGQGELEKDIKRRVYTEGAFIKPIGDDPNSRDAIVNIIEGQTGSIMLGAGVASDDGIVGSLVFDQRNFDITDWPQTWEELITAKAFKGAGQRLRISLEPGTEYSRYSVDFIEPYLFDKPVSLNLGGSNYSRDRESYEEDRLKGYIGFEKRYKDDWRRGFSFRAENVEVEDIDNDAPWEIRDVEGDNALYGIRVYIGKDTTDSRFLPTKGFNFDIGYEQVSGDHNFGVAKATQRWYKTLYEDFAGLKTVLETKLHGATTVGDAPPFEKFYAGGTGSLRGFEYRGVSTRGRSSTNPNKKEDPIGSDWLLLANAELAVPLGSETFAALFFIDTGAIDTGSPRAAVGTGLQILLPQWFGPVPMRFELATPVAKEDEDETRVFSFSIGALF